MFPSTPAHWLAPSCRVSIRARRTRVWEQAGPFSAELFSPCLRGFSPVLHVPRTQRHANVRLISNSRLSVGVIVGVNGCFSLYVNPVMNERLVKRVRVNIFLIKIWFGSGGKNISFKPSEKNVFRTKISSWKKRKIMWIFFFFMI